MGALTLADDGPKRAAAGLGGLIGGAVKVLDSRFRGNDGEVAGVTGG